MQVVKIVVLFALGIAILFVVGCFGDRVTAEDARVVNPEDYGSIEGNRSHDGYRLTEFMDACGSTAYFHDDGANIMAECNGWKIQIETYKVESGLDDPFWCTQIFLSREGYPSYYAFGHIKGAEPRVIVQPEQTLVRDTGKKPWRQKLEKAALEDLIELMTSGNLLEDNSNPLEGLSFTYLETDQDGTSWEHRPNSEPRQVANVSAVPPAESSTSSK